MKSDILSILSRFSPADNRDFKSFLKGRNFSENKKCLDFFSEILRFYPDYNITVETKQIIFKSLYGNLKYNDSTFRGLVHSLLILVEHFLVTKNIFKNDFERKFRLINELGLINVPDVLEKMLNKMEDDNRRFSSEHLVENYHLGILKYNFNKTNKRPSNQDQVVSQISIIDNSEKFLALFFFVESISNYINKKILIEKFSLNDISKRNLMDLIDIDKCRKFFENSDLFYLFDLYEKLLSMFVKYENNSHFYSYRSAVEEASEKLEKFELSQHYTLMVTYCIMKKSTEEGELLKPALWEIYMKILNLKLYTNDKNKYLDIYLYRSVLILGLELKKFTEIRELIDIYSLKVHPSEIENITNLGNAYYYTEVKEFKKALEYSNKISLSEFVFKYDIRNLLVKLYYELNYFDPLSSIIRSYYEFLKNDKLLNSDLKDGIRNFICYTEMLTKLSEKKDKIEMGYTMKKLSEETRIFAKGWLMEKYSSRINDQLSNVD